VRPDQPAPPRRDAQAGLNDDDDAAEREQGAVEIEFARPSAIVTVTDQMAQPRRARQLASDGAHQIRADFRRQ
jgi:hypothetical protein